MKIVVIEGLPLVGKTVLCKGLMQYFTQLGKTCIYCHHGHLTNDPIGEELYHRAINAYNSWYIQDAIYWSILSLHQDYKTFQSTYENYSKIDMAFLDRHYMGQYVVSEHFQSKVQIDFQRPKHYFEFLITANYKERLKRASVRKDYHSRLTIYTLSSSMIHRDFDQLYKNYMRITGIPNEHIIDNSDFYALNKMITIINKLI